MHKKLLYLMILLVLVLSMVGCQSKENTLDDEQILIQYYYENVCASCDPETEFIDNFETYTGISTRSPNLTIEMYNVYEDNDHAVWEHVAQEHNLDIDTFPILRIGDGFQYMGNIKDTLASPEVLSTLSHDTIPLNASVIVYFSSPGCHACMDVENQILNHLPQKISIDGTPSPIKLLKVSTAEKGSIELFRQYCDTFRVSEKDQKTPIAFVGYHALCGMDEIAKLPKILEQGGGLKTPLLTVEEDQQQNALLDYGWLGVFVTGLLNGLNPCAISMVLMLLSLLVVDKTLTTPVGLSFATGKFIGFFLLGTVLFTVVDRLPLNEVTMVTKVILLVLSAIMVLLNLNDLLAAKSERYNRIKLQLPQGLRKRNHSWIKRLLSVKKRGLLIGGGILLGLVMAAGEFLCTGQIYLAVIVQVVHSGAELSGKALFYLLLYSVAFIIPLLIMVILVAKGRQVFNLSDKFRRNMAWIKLGNMIVFLAFFVFVLLS